MSDTKYTHYHVIKATELGLEISNKVFVFGSIREFADQVDRELEVLKRKSAVALNGLIDEEIPSPEAVGSAFLRVNRLGDVQDMFDEQLYDSTPLKGEGAYLDALHLTAAEQLKDLAVTDTLTVSVVLADCPREECPSYAERLAHQEVCGFRDLEIRRMPDGTGVAVPMGPLLRGLKEHLMAEEEGEPADVGCKLDPETA